MTVKRQVPMTWGNRRHGVHMPYQLVASDHFGAAVSELTRSWQAGFNPAFCVGPQSGKACPLHDGEACAPVDQADIVLHQLPPQLGVAKAIREMGPSLPVGANGHLSTEVQAQIGSLRQALGRYDPQELFRTARGQPRLIETEGAQ
jgi:hypothetical protein